MEREILESLLDGALAPPQIALRTGRDLADVHDALRSMSAKGLLNPPITTQWGGDTASVMTHFTLSDRGHEELVRQRAADQPR
jgi:hypothetical protein